MLSFERTRNPTNRKIPFFSKHHQYLKFWIHANSTEVLRLFLVQTLSWTILVCLTEFSLRLWADVFNYLTNVVEHQFISTIVLKKALHMSVDVNWTTTCTKIPNKSLASAITLQTSTLWVQKAKLLNHSPVVRLALLRLQLFTGHDLKTLAKRFQLSRQDQVNQSISKK